MANKRMFSLSVVDTDNFLDMPVSARLLYYELGMRADDDGFVDNWKKILSFTGLKIDDMKLLIAKKFVIPFESGVIVIRHWRLNNYLQNDRHKPTIYQEEFKQLEYDKKSNVYNLYTDCIHSIDKNSIDKNSIDKNIYAQKFNQFYEAYPKKVSKANVEKWFNKNKPDDELFKKIMTSLENYKRSKQWQDKQYIPYPSTWLNQKRWEDEIEVEKTVDEIWQELEEELNEE